MTRPRTDLGGRPGGYGAGAAAGGPTGILPWENFLITIRPRVDETFNAEVNSNNLSYAGDPIEADLTGDPNSIGATPNAVPRLSVPSGTATFNLPSDLQYWAWSLSAGGVLDMDFTDTDSISLITAVNLPGSGLGDGLIIMAGISEGAPGIGMLGYFSGVTRDGSDYGLIESVDDAVWTETIVTTSVDRLSMHLENPAFVSDTVDESSYNTVWWGDSPKIILGKENSLTLGHFSDPYLVFGIGRRVNTGAARAVLPIVTLVMARTYG